MGTTDVMLYNSRSQNRKKPSSIYPESWSEFVCDLKAIEIMMSGNAEIKHGDIPGVLRVKGFTAENLEIIIHYDIKNKRIRTHYPNIF